MITSRQYFDYVERLTPRELDRLVRRATKIAAIKREQEKAPFIFLFHNGITDVMPYTPEQMNNCLTGRFPGMVPQALRDKTILSLELRFD